MGGGGSVPPAGSTGAGLPQDDGNRLQLKSDEKHGQILKKHMGSSARKMFVGGLAHETTTANLWEYFEQFGELEDVDIKTDVYTGCSRGFGFILFKVIDLFPISWDDNCSLGCRLSGES